MSHQLFLPRRTKQGQFLPSLFSRLVNSVRVAQMIFVRILILEHLATHLALDLIVSCVHVSHMAVELRPTDVLITLLAIHLACTSTSPSTVFLVVSTLVIAFFIRPLIVLIILQAVLCGHHHASS